MNPLVLMSDFGLKEHFVACMKGVAINVEPFGNLVTNIPGSLVGNREDTESLS